MGVVRAAIGIMAVALAAAPAQAEWLKADSTHFTIYGNVSPKEMAQFSDRLARFDAAMRKVIISPSDQTGASDKLSIYIVESTVGVQRLYNGGSNNVAGYYHATAAGAYAVTPRTTDNTAFTQQVLFHEYVHHVTLGSIRGFYPSWAAEGVAEFFGTARIMPDGTVRIGIPNNARAYSVLSYAPISVAALLSGRSDGSDALYARGWLLVHYLLLGEPKGGRLNTYINLLNQGVPQADAATQAFGDLRKLNAALNRYREGRFRSADFTAASLTIDPVTIRKLDAGEAAIMPLRMRSATGGGGREAQQLVAPARLIAAAYPQHAWVQRVLAEIEFDAGNDAEAEAACDAALAVKPNDVDALLYKGQVHVRRIIADKAATPERWREARGWFLKANRIDPNLALPFVLFYDSFILAREEPSANAITGLTLAAALVPQDGGLRFKLAMAMIHKGDLKSASTVLRPLAYQPHANADNPPAILLALLDSNADIATIKAQADAIAKKSASNAPE